MRIDFREERKWKLALAYNLSTSVLEWHFAKTKEERQRMGICVKWKPSQFKNDETKVSSNDVMETQVTSAPQTLQDVEMDSVDPKTDLLGINYGSDDEDENDQEKDDVIDSLEPAALMQDDLNRPDEIQPKDEEIDDQSAMTLLHQMSDTGDNADTTPTDSGHAIDELKALKTSSMNPVLGGSKSSSQSTNGDAEPPIAPTKLSQSELAPLREQIVYSADDQLFMDVDNLIGHNQAIGASKVDDISHNDVDLSTLFPDLQPFTMLDVAPPAPPPEGKKKPEKKSDRDDPNKRIEDTTYTKLYPTGRFMYSKPTLIGPLQASKRFKDGKWMPIEQVAITPEADFNVKVSDENTSGQ